MNKNLIKNVALCVVCAFFIMLSGCNKENDSVQEQNTTLIEDAGTRAIDFGAENYYLIEGEKIPLQKIDGKFIIMFHSSNEEKIKEELASSGVNILYEDYRTNYSSYMDYDMSGSGAKKVNDFKFVSVEGSYEQCATALQYAFYCAPYYKMPDKIDPKPRGISNLFYIVLKPETTLAQLEKLANENNVEMLGFNTTNKKLYYLACTDNSKGNALEMANLFYESGLFENFAPHYNI